jgi:hypothetical protein
VRYPSRLDVAGRDGGPQILGEVEEERPTGVAGSRCGRAGDLDRGGDARL